MNNIALGRYVPNNTVIHRMDPRIKLVSMIVMMVAIFLSYADGQIMNFTVYGGIFLILLVVMLVGKVSFLRIFKSLKALWFMMIFLFILNLFLVREGNVILNINGFMIYDGSIYRTLYIFLRLVLMLMLTTILTSTTKPLELTFALEWLLTPLKLLRFPVHIVAMTLSLTLRFIPTLIEESNKIMKAQASRGVDFREGKLKEKFRAVISLVIPLFVSCFIRSGELADAMEARGYNPLGKRTKFERRHWTYKDTLGILVIGLFLAGIITLAVFQINIDAMIPGMVA